MGMSQNKRHINLKVRKYWTHLLNHTVIAEIWNFLEERWNIEKISSPLYKLNFKQSQSQVQMLELTFDTCMK